MLTTIDVRREARNAGIRSSGDLDLAMVERRRRQLWTVMTLVLFLVSLAAGATALFPDLAQHMVISQRFLQLMLPAVSLAFAAYGWEKERSLRRLTGAVMDEQLTKEQLSVQARQLRAALEAGRQLSACLDPAAVTDTLLGGAMDLFDARDGSLLMMDAGRLSPTATRGDDRGAHLEHDAVELVAETRIPVRLDPEHGGGRNAMAVPVVSEARLHGVLVVSASGAREFSDHDLSVLAAFGEYAGQALENAERYEDARAHADRLEAIEAAQSEFSWLRRDAIA